jgi:nucleotide-binding universal stress UspA family protein
MKKLMVPVDGSGAALRALEQAIALAKGSDDAVIHLVHAHEEPDLYGEIAVYVPRARMEELQRSHSEGCLAPAEAVLNVSGVRYTKDVLVGPIAETIARHAEKTGCDAIVMGRHGRSALGGLLMGSVAMKVLHATRLPVLLVR